ncbi:aspartate carbamoyltransferase, partial [Sarracenia purpurea var. burkii]
MDLICYVQLEASKGLEPLLQGGIGTHIFVLSFQDDIKDYLTIKGVEWEESEDLLEVASKCDVLYQTRIQRERFGERIDIYEEARGKYIVDRTVLGVMQKRAVVMHPLPRLDE